MTTAPEPTNDDRPRRRWEPDARRQQILSCAVRLFGERGYEEVSIAEVAAAAGVARGLVNHYFGTKKELYLDAVRVLMTVPDDALDEASRAAPAGDLPSRVDGAVSWFLDAVSRYSQPFLAVVGATGAQGDPDVAAAIAEADEVTIDAILRLARHPDDAREPGRARRVKGDGEELRAALRAYVSFARTGAVEWLVRHSLTREQTQLLLTHTLVGLLSRTIPELSRSAVSPPAAP